MAMKRALEAVERIKEPVVPLHLRNAPTSMMKGLGYGEGYRYPHDEPHGFAHGVRYLPEGVEGGWYEPSSYGQERTIAERMHFWRSGDQGKTKA